MDIQKELFQPNQDTIREQIKMAARETAFIGILDSKTHQALVRNPFCGDEIEITVLLNQEERVQSLKAQVRGCLVARAAWSLLAPKIQGLTRKEALEELTQFESELANESAGALYTSLRGPVSSLLTYRLPSPRHACATLGSQALLQALQPEHCNQ